MTRPALLAGLARCARCGSGLVRLKRAHGGPETWRRVHMYGCGRVSRGLPCENRVALEEGSVDQAVLEALAEALSADAIEEAVTAALQDARTTLAGSAARRAELAREATVLEERIGRLTEHLAAETGVAARLSRSWPRRRRAAWRSRETVTPSTWPVAPSTSRRRPGAALRGRPAGPWAGVWDCRAP